MQLSAQGLELLKRSEGFRTKTYIDIAGNATIGYGHKLMEHESYPNGIDEAKGEALLTADVYCAERAVLRLVRVPLTQGQFDALVDFTFNLGSARLASSTLLADLNAKDYVGAALQLLKWDHAGHAEVAALKARRHSEFDLWQGKASA